MEEFRNFFYACLPSPTSCWVVLLSVAHIVVRNIHLFFYLKSKRKKFDLHESNVILIDKHKLCTIFSGMICFSVQRTMQQEKRLLKKIMTRYFHKDKQVISLNGSQYVFFFLFSYRLQNDARQPAI